MKLLVKIIVLTFLILGVGSCKKRAETATKTLISGYKGEALAFIPLAWKNKSPQYQLVLCKTAAKLKKVQDLAVNLEEDEHLSPNLLKFLACYSPFHRIFNPQDLEQIAELVLKAKEDQPHNSLLFKIVGGALSFIYTGQTEFYTNGVVKRENKIADSLAHDLKDPLSTTYLSPAEFSLVKNALFEAIVQYFDKSVVIPTDDSLEKTLLGPPIGIGLSALLNLKCDFYTKFNFYQKLLCSLTARKMLYYLDIRSDWPSVAIFEKRLVSLIKTYKIQKYLRELIKYDQNKESERVSIWRWTLDYFNQDKGQALAVFAVLFQDTNHYLHVKYLQEVHLDIEPRYITRLKKANEIVKKPARFLLLSPELGINKETLYHFMVPAYLSYSMSKEYMDDLMVAKIPFVFNMLYEYFTSLNLETRQTLDRKLDQQQELSPFMVNLSRSAILLGGFSEPLPYSKKEFETTLKDIYMGYAGALFGMDKHHAKLDFATFAECHAKDPKEFLFAIFRGEEGLCRF